MTRYGTNINRGFRTGSNDAESEHLAATIKTDYYVVGTTVRTRTCLRLFRQSVVFVKGGLNLFELAR
jgi:hypothetical protein